MYVITKVKIVYLNLTLHFAIKAVQDFKMHGTQLHNVQCTYTTFAWSNKINYFDEPSKCPF